MTPLIMATHTHTAPGSAHQRLSGLLPDADHADGVGLHQGAVHGGVVGCLGRGRDLVALGRHHVMSFQQRLRRAGEVVVIIKAQFQ